MPPRKLSKAGRYPANVFWNDEDDGFIAAAPDLPSSSAFGRTAAEALAELEQAIEAWIEAATAAGNPIPEPSRPSAPEYEAGEWTEELMEDAAKISYRRSSPR